MIKHIHTPKIKKIYNASRHELLPEELGRLIPTWTVALNSKAEPLRALQKIL
ncbi:MAG TPA: hypothetical protein VEL70_09950 [Candidatus Acidoferrum sp.]|nr:hypothetical protein [Candidatus Acidoferrum sp.]